MTISNFLKLFSLFNIILAIFPATIQLFFPGWGIIIPEFWLLFIFFDILTLTMFFLVAGLAKIFPEHSIQVLLAAITLKLLICLSIIIVYVIKKDINQAGFIAGFFYLYLFHTVFEIYTLLRNLRHPKKK